MKTTSFRTLAALLMVAAALTATAQTHTLRVGLGGGLFSLGQRSEQPVQNHLGGLGQLDLGYVYLAPVSSVSLGVRTGLQLGFGTGRLDGSFSHQFTRTDYLGDRMDYTTSGLIDVREQVLTGQVPVMMALSAKGFTLGVGLSLQTTLWQRAAQTLSEPLIDAYYPSVDVHVQNELITGVVPESQLEQSGRFGAPGVGLGLALELGYEFAVGRQDAVGIQAFLSYSLCNNYHSALAPVISVDPITDAVDPVPAVTVSPATQALVDRMHPLEVGLRLYYAISLPR